MAPGCEAVGSVGQGPGVSLFIQTGMKPRVLGRDQGGRRVNMDRPGAGAGLRAHGNGIAGDDDAVGESQITVVGVVLPAHVLATILPAMNVGRLVDGADQRLGGGTGAAAGRYQQGTPRQQGHFRRPRAQFPGHGVGEFPPPRGAADNQRDPGFRQMIEPPAPAFEIGRALRIRNRSKYYI